MEIEDLRVVAKKKEEAKKGDIIQIRTSAIGLVCKNNNGNSDEFDILLLKESSYPNWFAIACRDGEYMKDFKKGKYRILARVNDWKISYGSV